MKATQILSSEHRVIERVIDSLEKASSRLEAGQAIPADFFIQAAEFIRGFADGCHHRKEEGVLFEKMVMFGLSKEQGPVAVMLAEHEQGRLFTRQMKSSALKYLDGDNSAKAEIIQNARGYCSLLRQHIQKEDRILFPMADNIIPVPEQDQIIEDFEHVEHEETGEGVHEKYLAIAEKLENEMK